MTSVKTSERSEKKLSSPDKANSIPLQELVTYTDNLLNNPAMQDYCPNGLQVGGRPTVAKLVSGVTANLALIEAAIEAEADLLLVHHGYFWKGEDARLVGIKRNRLARLLSANISLLVYHLPLDCHPLYGNNARLGQLLGIENSAPMENLPLVWNGTLSEERSGGAFAARITTVLNRTPLHVPGTKRPIKHIAWCSGAGQGYLEQAARRGMDAYLTGEVSEWTVHMAREYGLHFFAAGHHATERYGVQALGGHLAEHFGIRHEFIEIENPA